jgi:hypothetical protein
VLVLLSWLPSLEEPFLLSEEDDNEAVVEEEEDECELFANN